MVADVAKITQTRKAVRDNGQSEHRSYMALEMIADTLEAMRADAAGFQQALMTYLLQHRKEP